MMKRLPQASLFTACCVVAWLTLCGAERTRAQETELRRPAAIAAEEVPVVPDERWHELSRYQDTRGAAFHGWAPDGSGILISTRFGNASQLHRVYQPEGRREQITFFDEPVSERSRSCF